MRLRMERKNNARNWLNILKHCGIISYYNSYFGFVFILFDIQMEQSLYDELSIKIVAPSLFLC